MIYSAQNVKLHLFNGAKECEYHVVEPIFGLKSTPRTTSNTPSNFQQKLKKMSHFLLIFKLVENTIFQCARLGSTNLHLLFFINALVKDLSVKSGLSHTHEPYLSIGNNFGKSSHCYVHIFFICVKYFACFSWF